MIRAGDLARASKQATLTGNANAPVAGLVEDSRKVQPGDAFVAIRGPHFDGHRFIADAIQKGASVIVAESPPQDAASTWIQVSDSRRDLALMADAVFGSPWRDMTLVGVTGTNGKTSTAYLIQSVFEAAGRPCARFGTIGHQIGDREIDAKTTTPGALELYDLLDAARAQKIDAAAMEVSSHALAMHRVSTLRFDAAAFTNLSQDHLDYHASMDEYRDVKRRLFRQMKDAAAAVINADDATALLFINTASESGSRVLTYGLGESADVRALDISATAFSTSFTLVADGRETSIELSLLGDYNVYNALAAIGVGLGLGIELDAVKQGVVSLKSVPGRFESVEEGQPFGVVVDYAHTPDALERVARAARALDPKRLVVVFGCGGDRDAGKRPKMGRIAAELADVAVVTSDNPRTEDPDAIIADIHAGIPDGAHCVTIPDRAAAIQFAIESAEPGDMVVIAGKGHETYQEIDGVRSHFDDRETARRFLRGA